jgi:hypothetical protein
MRGFSSIANIWDPKSLKWTAAPKIQRALQSVSTIVQLQLITPSVPWPMRSDNFLKVGNWITNLEVEKPSP